MAALWNFSRQLSLSSVMHELYFLPLIDHLPMGQPVLVREIPILKDPLYLSHSGPIVRAAQLLKRQCNGALYLFHHESCIYIRGLRLYQLLVKPIVAWHVGHHSLYQVINFTRHPVDLENTMQSFHDVAKSL